MTQRRPASDGSVVVRTRYATNPDPRGPFEPTPDWTDSQRLVLFGIAPCQAVSASLNTFPVAEPHSPQHNKTSNQ